MNNPSEKCKPATPPPKWRRRIKRLIACLLLVPVVGSLAFLAAVAWWPYPSGIDRAPLAGTFIEDRKGVPLAALVNSDGQWQLPLSHDQISPHLLTAIVAVEDSRFFEHGGVDWKSAAGALWQDVRHLSIRRGGSTLTMQLQRLRDPQPRTFFNKIEQAIRARQLDRATNKQAILVEYLNRAPFGGNLVGAGAASWRYFGRPCRDLSLGEAALLAGLPQSPNRLRPDRHPEAALSRRNHVLDRMLAAGIIDAHQRDEAAREPITAQWRPLPQDSIPTAMPALAGLAQRYPGQVIHSTLDRETQQRASTMVESQVRALRLSGVSAAAAVVLDTATGECLASVSEQIENAGGVDLTLRPRSTGSTLKPFIYAAAFDAGICAPTTTLLDSPAAWPGYSPGNYDRAFRGPMPAADALAESRNIPALVLLGKIGVERSVGILESFGLSTIARAKHPYGLSLAIGGAEAPPMELAEAYATLARGGLWRRASLVLDEPNPPHRVMRAAPCWQAVSSISEFERTSAICPEAAALHVAWKTGTSSGHRDAWCAAVTPRRTVIVWLGNPRGEASAALIGQEAAAPLALRLIASLDSGGPAWPEVPSPAPRSAAAVKWVAAKSQSTLTLLSPNHGQQIVLNSDLPSAQQQVLLEASTAENGLWWFIDDEPAGQERRTWWTPSPGTHQIRAVDSEGHTTATTIHVR